MIFENASYLQIISLRFILRIVTQPFAIKLSKIRYITIYTSWRIIVTELSKSVFVLPDKNSKRLFYAASQEISYHTEWTTNLDQPIAEIYNARSLWFKIHDSIRLRTYLEKDKRWTTKNLWIVWVVALKMYQTETKQYWNFEREFYANIFYAFIKIIKILFLQICKI